MSIYDLLYDSSTCNWDPAKFLNYHDQILKIRNHKYNPYINLLRVSFAPRYSNSTLKLFFKYYKVHSTRESLRYAISLLQTGDKNMILRAQKIVCRVLSLQNTNPASPYYGSWPKHWEESVSGISRPDLNWADFLGASLLVVYIHHRHQLTVELTSRIHTAIIHAAQAIQRRDVDPNYTNIAVLGTYVTLVAAETFGIEDLFEYALKRLGRIREMTLPQGIFTEYNSPMYGVTTLDALGRLRLHVKDQQAKEWTEDLYHLAWENIAHRFHPPTRQLAGPHSRSYSTLLKPSVLALIEQGTNGSVSFGLSEQVMLESRPDVPLPCPADLVPYFVGISEPRTCVNTVLHESPHRQLTTYLCADFTLGSVNYSDLWHQRRSLLAYWGTPERLGYLKLRFLCDGDDFAPAQLASVQSKGNILAGIMFATDIDRRNPYESHRVGHPLQLKDLRLRLEVMGAIQAVKQSADGSSLECCIEGLWVHLAMVYAQFGHWIGQWELTQGKSNSYLDWVFFKDRLQTIDWAKLTVAGMGLGISLSKQYEGMPSITKRCSDGVLSLNSGPLALSFQICPDRQVVLHQSIGHSDQENSRMNFTEQKVS